MEQHVLDGHMGTGRRQEGGLWRPKRCRGRSGFAELRGEAGAGWRGQLQATEDVCQYVEVVAKQRL